MPKVRLSGAGAVADFVVAPKSISMARAAAGARLKNRQMEDFARLGAEAAARIGATAITEPSPLAGGASRALYGFDARLADDSTAELVLLVTSRRMTMIGESSRQVYINRS